MRTRSEIQQQIADNKEKIKAIENDNIELEVEALQISDDKRWYKEGEETHIVKEGRKKIPTKFMIGRVYWNEFFQDESKPKGEGVTIERSRIVRQDGTWYL